MKLGWIPNLDLGQRQSNAIKRLHEDIANNKIQCLILSGNIMPSSDGFFEETIADNLGTHNRIFYVAGAREVSGGRETRSNMLSKLRNRGGAYSNITFLGNNPAFIADGVWIIGVNGWYDCNLEVLNELYPDGNNQDIPMDILSTYMRQDIMNIMDLRNSSGALTLKSKFNVMALWAKEATENLKKQLTHLHRSASNVKRIIVMDHFPYFSRLADNGSIVEGKSAFSLEINSMAGVALREFAFAHKEIDFLHISSRLNQNTTYHPLRNLRCYSGNSYYRNVTNGTNRVALHLITT